MNIHKHRKVTYDNYRRYFSGHSFNCNCRVYQKTQIKEKDNRLLVQSKAVIF